MTVSAPGPPPDRGVRRLAWTAVAATLALIALGGVVRVTGSGMGCGDDWPLCHGRLLPPLDAPTLIEYAHRLAAAVVSVLVLALAAVAWRRRDPGRAPAAAAAAILVVQVLLGAVTVRLGLPAWTVVLHLGTAMLLLAALLGAALARPGGPARQDVARRRLAVTGAAPVRAAALAAVVLGFAVVLAGGLVANLHAGAACHGFPLCSGSWLPPGGVPAALHWSHRALAFTLLALLAVGSLRAGPGVRAAWGMAFAAALLQVGLAAAMVLGSLPGELRAAHAAMGAVVWASLVVLLLRAGRTTAAEAPEAIPHSAASRHGRRAPPRGASVSGVTVVAGAAGSDREGGS